MARGSPEFADHEEPCEQALEELLAEIEYQESRERADDACATGNRPAYFDRVVSYEHNRAAAAKADKARTRANTRTTMRDSHAFHRSMDSR